MYGGAMQGETGCLTQELRALIQDMMTVTHALASKLSGDEKAEGYLAVLNRAICAQLHLIRQAELDERLKSQNEIRLDRTLIDLVTLGRDIMDSTEALTGQLLDIKAEFICNLATLTTMADGYALREMFLYYLASSVRAIGRAGDIRLKLESRNGQAVFTMTDSARGAAGDAAVHPLEGPEEPERCALERQMVRRIVELHGGTLITGHTEAGGTRVAVSIPIVERAGGVLHSSGVRWESGGGWDPILVGLSGCLPAEAFLPECSRR